MKTCRDCPNEAVHKGRCRDCQNRYQRERYHANRDIYIETRKRLYTKHADKRREESSIRKANNRVRYSLLEWFRKNGVKAEDIPKDDLNALVEMKEALLTKSKL